MAWCDVVEPRTLRECRIAVGQSQATFAAMLGVSPESYRTWDAGRLATPPKMLARARALAAHRNDHDLLPLPVLALLVGVHVKRRCCMNTLWGWGGLARTSPDAVLPVAPAAGGGPLNGRLAGSYRPNIP